MTLVKFKIGNIYNEALDEYTDHQDIIFKFHHYNTRRDHYGLERKFKVYEAIEYFEDPKRKQLVTTPRGNQRRISINGNWEYFKYLTKRQLQSQTGTLIYARRKIDVEPVFADVKAHLRFTRFSVRGLKKTKNDIGLVLMAMNIIKWAKERASFV